jgi:hypothetical protein
MAFPVFAKFAHPDNGYPWDQEAAAAHLTPGRVYLVRRLEVGRGAMSALYLAHLPDIPFNPVMFEGVTECDRPRHIDWVAGGDWIVVYEDLAGPSE